MTPSDSGGAVRPSHCVRRYRAEQTTGPDWIVASGTKEECEAWIAAHPGDFNITYGVEPYPENEET